MVGMISVVEHETFIDIGGYKHVTEPKKLKEPVTYELHGIYGVINLAGSYIIGISDSVPVGLLFNHEVREIKAVCIIPIVNSPADKYLLSLAMRFFSLPGNYFSEYNIGGDEEFLFNSVVMKNFESIFKQKATYVIQGYFGQVRRGDAVFSMISRRSYLYAGARFWRRGINADGHPANNVETLQILEEGGYTKIFTLLRGSIPLKWKQPPGFRLESNITVLDSDLKGYDKFNKYNKVNEFSSSAPLNPNEISDKKEDIPNPEVKSESSPKEKGAEDGALVKKRAKEGWDTLKHVLEPLDSQFYYVFVPLTKSKGYESEITRTFLRELESHAQNFHYYDLVARYPKGFHDFLNELKEYIQHRTERGTAQGPESVSHQRIVIRVNCIDSLDRTNVMQYFISTLAFPNLSPELKEDLKNLWINNGNTISIQYSSTPFLKSELITGIKTIQIKDALYSITRYIQNRFYDGEKQTMYDIVTGNSEKMKIERRYPIYKFIALSMIYLIYCVIIEVAFNIKISKIKKIISILIGYTSLIFILFDLLIDYPLYTPKEK